MAVALLPQAELEDNGSLVAAVCKPAHTGKQEEKPKSQSSGNSGRGKSGGRSGGASGVTTVA